MPIKNIAMNFIADVPVSRSVEYKIKDNTNKQLYLTLLFDADGDIDVMLEGQCKTTISVTDVLNLAKIKV